MRSNRRCNAVTRHRKTSCGRLAMQIFTGWLWVLSRLKVTVTPLEQKVSWPHVSAGSCGDGLSAGCFLKRISPMRKIPQKRRRQHVHNEKLWYEEGRLARMRRRSWGSRTEDCVGVSLAAYSWRRFRSVWRSRWLLGRGSLNFVICHEASADTVLRMVKTECVLARIDRYAHKCFS